jgi:predicted nucleotidyltransferase
MYRLEDKKSELNGNIQEILSKCSKQINSLYPDADIILYGSQAKNQAAEYSDIDIIVLLAEPVSEKQKKQIHDLLYEIGLRYDAVISVFIKSRQNWQSPISKATSLYKSVQKEGIIIG